jgi:hypothetical protein
MQSKLLSVRPTGPLTCVWIATTNRNSPLTCVWIHADQGAAINASSTPEEAFPIRPFPPTASPYLPGASRLNPGAKQCA